MVSMSVDEHGIQGIVNPLLSDIDQPVGQSAFMKIRITL